MDATRGFTSFPTCTDFDLNKTINLNSGFCVKKIQPPKHLLTLEKKNDITVFHNINKEYFITSLEENGKKALVLIKNKI